MPEHLAHRRRAGRQRPIFRRAVERAAAADGPLAPYVQRRQRVHLPRVRGAGDHAVLLLHRRVGPGRLHPPELERRPGVAVQIRQDRGRRHRLLRKPQRRAAAHGPHRLRHGRAVRRQEHAAHAVIGPHAREILAHDVHAGRAPLPDSAMQRLDGGFFHAEWRLGHARNPCRSEGRRRVDEDHPRAHWAGVAIAVRRLGPKNERVARLEREDVVTDG